MQTPSAAPADRPSSRCPATSPPASQSTFCRRSSACCQRKTGTSAPALEPIRMNRPRSENVPTSNICRITKHADFKLLRAHQGASPAAGVPPVAPRAERVQRPMACAVARAEDRQCYQSQQLLQVLLATSVCRGACRRMAAAYAVCRCHHDACKIPCANP